MNQTADDLPSRVTRLERQLSQTRRVVALAFLIAALAAASVFRSAPKRSDVVRAKAIVVEDAQGRDRILLGAPVPEPAGARRQPTTGMVIRDPEGAERFGVGLMADGLMNMGFDAPPGKGDDRNRERVDISTDPDGGAELRVLDRFTWVRARVALDAGNKVGLEFLDYPAGAMVTRRFSINGMELTREPRR